MSVELNVDLGELPDEPERLYSLATVVNIACGGHAGDEASMRRALSLAKKSGAHVAAHPGYADRAGFGRTSHFAPATVAARGIALQCSELARIADEQHIAITILKLHGALYHDASVDEALATVVVDAARWALPKLVQVVGPPRSMLERCALSRKLAFVSEGFVDRRYDEEGKLVPRSQPGAMLLDNDACVEQALRLAASGRFATLCIHGDNPDAEGRAAAVRRALETAGLLHKRAHGSNGAG